MIVLILDLVPSYLIQLELKMETILDKVRISFIHFEFVFSKLNLLTLIPRELSLNKSK